MTILTTVLLIVMVGCGLLAGGLLMVTAGVAPALRQQSLARYASLHSALDTRIETFMPKIGRSTVAGVVVLLLFSDSSAMTWTLSVHLVLIAAVVLVSETVNVPLNRAIAEWS